MTCAAQTPTSASTTIAAPKSASERYARSNAAMRDREERAERSRAQRAPGRRRSRAQRSAPDAGAEIPRSARQGRSCAHPFRSASPRRRRRPSPRPSPPPVITQLRRYSRTSSGVTASSGARRVSRNSQTYSIAQASAPAPTNASVLPVSAAPAIAAAPISTNAVNRIQRWPCCGSTRSWRWQFGQRMKNQPPKKRCDRLDRELAAAVQRR